MAHLDLVLSERAKGDEQTIAIAVIFPGMNTEGHAHVIIKVDAHLLANGDVAASIAFSSPYGAVTHHNHFVRLSPNFLPRRLLKRK